MKNHHSGFPKSWLRLGLFSALVFSASLSLQAQTAPAKLWDKTLGGSAAESFSIVKQTSDGGFILGGHSNSGISGDKSQASLGGADYWVVKTDANGNKVWDKTFGGSAEESFRTLQPTTDGGYIIGGYSNSGLNGDKSQASKGGFDYWVIKLDASGNKTWDKTFGGSAEEKLFSVQQTADGGYILGGTSASGLNGDKSQASLGGNDYWVVKLDASGNKTWDKTFGGTTADDLYTLQQTADGGYILGGNSNSGIGGDKSQASVGLNDYWVIKLDASGSKTWDKTLGGSGDDVVLFSIQQTVDGGYVMGGSSASGISGDKTEAAKGGNDYWVVKLDASGIKTWDKTLGGSAADNLRSLQQTTDGGYILGGTSASGIGGDKSEALLGLTDYWVVKLNANGNKTWDKTLGTSGTDFLASLRQTSDGGFILGGNSDSGINGDKSQASIGGNDFWIIKLAAAAPAATIDVAVNAISGVTSGCGLTSQETITITIINHGTTPQSNIPVSYSINGTAVGSGVIAGPIAAGATATYTFATKADLSTFGNYSIEAKTNLSGDAFMANDAFTKAVTSFAIPNAPTISASGPSTLCSGGAVALIATSTTPGVTYQWHLNGSPIAGATSAYYTANASGNYTATAIVAGNCSSPASAATVLTLTATPNTPALSANGPLTFCLGGSVSLIATAAAGSAFTWFKNGNVISGATAGTYIVSTPGSYTVTASINGCGSPVSAVANISVKNTPATPSITQNGFVLTSSSSAGNQWYKDGVLIPGATGTTFTTTANGTYTVAVTMNGCSSVVSNAVNITTTGLREEIAPLEVVVYPNPSKGIFNLAFPKGQVYELVVTDLTGKEVVRQTVKEANTQVNLGKAAQGLYLLKLESEGKTAFRKLIVE